MGHIMRRRTRLAVVVGAVGLGAFLLPLVPATATPEPGSNVPATPTALAAAASSAFPWVGTIEAGGSTTGPPSVDGGRFVLGEDVTFTLNGDVAPDGVNKARVTGIVSVSITGNIQVDDLGHACAPIVLSMKATFADEPGALVDLQRRGNGSGDNVVLALPDAVPPEFTKSGQEPISPGLGIPKTCQDSPVYATDFLGWSSGDFGCPAVPLPSGQTWATLENAEAITGTGSVAFNPFKTGSPGSCSVGGGDQDNTSTAINATYDLHRGPIAAEFSSDAFDGDPRVRFDAVGSTRQANYAWDFGDGSSGHGFSTVHAYAKAGEYAVTLTVTSGGRSASVTHTVAADPVATYAPTVVLHPNESRYPYDPASFVKHSTLTWSHDGLCPDDTFATPVTASRLGSGGYQHRRASDLDCSHIGSSYTSRQLTAPRDDRSVLPKGEKLEGFYLDLNDRYYNGTKKMSTVPMYYEFKSDKYVVYWLFYAFNHWKGTKQTLGFDERHEGDWEHIVVQLSPTNSAREMAFYEHYCQPTVKSWATMRGGFGSGTGLDGGTHPLVFAAEGGHASYWKPGTWRNGDGQTRCGATGKREMVIDQTRASSKKWRPWAGAGLRNARTAGWYGFGGLWGRPGKAKGLFSSGILGPSKYKFNDPKVNVVPPAWQ